MATPVDTNYYLKQGESIDAYNQRIAAYNASKSSAPPSPASSAPAPASSPPASTMTRTSASSSPAPAQSGASGTQYVTPDSSGGVRIGSTWYGPGSKLPTGYDYDYNKPKEGAPSQQPNQAATQQNPNAPQKLLTYNPATNPSVVDLLNSVGQASDFSSRSALAGQLGIQGYKGTAAQNQELAKKFTELYNSKSTTTAPQSPADFMQQYQQYQEENKTPQRYDDIQDAFKETYGQMNPVEKFIFDGLSELLSTESTKKTLSQLYKDEVAAQGIPELNEELADIKKIIDGTEDDIRAEIQHSSGIATESQVKALAGARNKVLIRQAQYLSDLVESKNDYVDRLVALTQADREQLDKDLDRKLGISKMMLDMTDKMQTRARENYQNIIKDIGYDGLVKNITSQRELESVASALGMSPNTLLRLSNTQTTAQRQMELDMMAFNLSVDKFEEEKRQFGLTYALERQKLAQQKAAQSIISPYTTEKAERAFGFIEAIRPDVNNFTVGLGSLTSGIPGTPAADFRAKVSALESAISFGELQEMRDASKTGGALGNVAIKELELLGNSLGALSTSQSPGQFSNSLNTIEGSLYRWNAQKLSAATGYNYSAAKSAGYDDKSIYEHLVKKTYGQ